MRKYLHLIGIVVHTVYESSSSTLGARTATKMNYIYVIKRTAKRADAGRFEESGRKSQTGRNGMPTRRRNSVFGGLRSSGDPPRPGSYPERSRFSLPVQSVVVSPELAACRYNQQVEAASCGKLVGLVPRLGIFRRLVRKSLVSHSLPAMSVFWLSVRGQSRWIPYNLPSSVSVCP